MAQANLVLITTMASMKDIEETFSEWDRRYRENPEQFMSEAQRLLKETPETYGEACAPYFLRILNEVTGQKKTDHESVQTSAPGGK